MTPGSKASAISLPTGKEVETIRLAISVMT